MCLRLCRFFNPAGCADSFPFISLVRVALFVERRGSKVYRLLLTANNFTIVFFFFFSSSSSIE